MISCGSRAIARAEDVVRSSGLLGGVEYDRAQLLNELGALQSVTRVLAVSYKIVVSLLKEIPVRIVGASESLLGSLVGALRAQEAPSARGRGPAHSGLSVGADEVPPDSI